MNDNELKEIANDIRKMIVAEKAEQLRMECAYDNLYVDKHLRAEYEESRFRQKNYETILRDIENEQKTA